MITSDSEGPFCVSNTDVYTKMEGDHLIRGSDGIIYNCVQVAMLKEKWKQDFREKNNTDKIISHLGRDKYYESFCEEIESSIKCNCYKKALENARRREKFNESRMLLTQPPKDNS